MGSVFNGEVSGEKCREGGGLLWRDRDTAVSRVLTLSAFIVAIGLTHAAPNAFLQIKLRRTRHATSLPQLQHAVFMQIGLSHLDARA